MWRIAQSRVEAPDAEAKERGLHAVDDAGSLADQLFTLAMWPFCILLFGNRCGGITYKFCARVEMMSSVAD